MRCCTIRHGHDSQVHGPGHCGRCRKVLPARKPADGPGTASTPLSRGKAICARTAVDIAVLIVRKKVPARELRTDHPHVSLVLRLRVQSLHFQEAC